MNVLDPLVVCESVVGPAAQIDFVVPNDLEYFDGHFPGAPIVPGVVQIKWAIDGARRCLAVSDSVARAMPCTSTFASIALSRSS